MNMAELKLTYTFLDFVDCIIAQAAIIEDATVVSAEAIMRAESRSYSNFKELKGDVKGIRKKGLRAADELYEQIENSISSAVAAKSYFDKQAELEREKRKYAINRAMEKFDEKADRTERDINLMFGEMYMTNLERNLTGSMSNRDFLVADDIRQTARSKYQKEVEAEYNRAKHKAEEDDD